MLTGHLLFCSSCLSVCAASGWSSLSEDCCEESEKGNSGRCEQMCGKLSEPGRHHENIPLWFFFTAFFNDIDLVERAC